MFTINEYAAGLIITVTGATALFMACVMVLVFIKGITIVTHTMRKPKHVAIQPNGKWMTVESRKSYDHDSTFLEEA